MIRCSAWRAWTRWSTRIRVAAILARQLGADALVILTNVDAVYEGWGTPAARPLRRLTVAEAERMMAGRRVRRRGHEAQGRGRGRVRPRQRRPGGHRAPGRRAGRAARRGGNHHSEGHVNLHEYQARALLKAAGVPMPDGDVASTPTEAEAIARRIGGTVVIKAQVHAGGRGKAGGVKLARNPAEATDEAGPDPGHDRSRDSPSTRCWWSRPPRSPPRATSASSWTARRSGRSSW